MEKSIIEISQQLKSQLLGVMNSMTAFTIKYPKAGLPNAEDDFIKSKSLLEKGEFNFAICGKVKSGKSSLINALIGRELLPVSNDVATSCVFKISHAEKESFFVVYTNGDKKEIKESELSFYGSQTSIDVYGQQDVDKVVEFIEVNTKLEFLPKGVSIIDTPGIGSTYPQHTAITKRSVKMADAVLFVVNPAPLEDIEVEFLRSLVDITPCVMFVMTKIDLDSTEAVGENTLRIANQVKKEIVDEKKESFYGDIRILKMSSRLLMESVEEENKKAAEKKYKVSHFADVKSEMLNQIFLTQGYYRTGLAYNAAVEYYQRIYSALHNRLDAAKSMGDNYETMLNEYESARLAFNNQFGETKRKEIFGKIQMMLSAMDDDLRNMFVNISNKYVNEINDLSDNQEVETYKEKLPENITNELNNEWAKLIQDSYNEIKSILKKFASDCELLLPKTIYGEVSQKQGEPVIGKISFGDQVKAARSEMLLAGVSTTIAYTLVNAAATFAPAWTMSMAAIINPAFAILGISVLAWGFFVGKSKAKAKQLASAKQALIQYVVGPDGVIEECKKQLINRSIKNGEYESVYQGLKKTIQAEAQASIAETYEKYKKELDSMKATLQESRNSPKMVEALEYMIKAWESQRTILQSIKEGLENNKWIDDGGNRN